ncbi:hypothetical protein OIU79_024320 [Salix purpurea]|uniref:Uncharacterized protein n=1 Tax=Salix purpurea TaxID=77065 RepID=A0A9Q0WDQ5_SALPP|nr:hypothetical protein OIU79_024320 [Salix purpurea]
MRNQIINEAEAEKANQEKLNRGGQKLLESCFGVWRSPLEVLKLKRGGDEATFFEAEPQPFTSLSRQLSLAKDGRMGKVRKVRKWKVETEGKDDDNGRGPTLTATKLPLLLSPVKDEDDYLDALATAAAEDEQGASTELTTAQ